MRVLVSYNAKDEDLKQELLAHLDPAVRAGRLSLWDRSRVPAGEYQQDVFRTELAGADVVLVLLSANYLASGGVTDDELTHTAEQRTRRELRVVPILLSACAWHDEPRLQGLQPLPRDGQPLRRRPDRESALIEIYGELNDRARFWITCDVVLVENLVSTVRES